MNTTSKGKALITGASSGIGAIYSGRLAKRGYDLILVARNQQPLQALANRLLEETGRSVEVMVAVTHGPGGDEDMLSLPPEGPRSRLHLHQVRT
jgi:hypothetical protein